MAAARQNATAIVGFILVPSLFIDIDNAPVLEALGKPHRISRCALPDPECNAEAIQSRNPPASSLSDFVAFGFSLIVQLLIAV
jgi:hypothetical protein